MNKELENKVLDVMYDAVLRLSKDAAVRHVRETQGEEAAAYLRANLDTKFGECAAMTATGVVLEKYRDIIGNHYLLDALEVHIEVRIQRVLSALEARAQTIH